MQRLFSHAGGTVEDQVGDMPAFDQAPEHHSLSKQMALSHHLVEAFWPQRVGQRGIHQIHLPFVLSL